MPNFTACHVIDIFIESYTNPNCIPHVSYAETQRSTRESSIRSDLQDGSLSCASLVFLSDAADR